MKVLAALFLSVFLVLPVHAENSVDWCHSTADAFDLDNALVGQIVAKVPHKVYFDSHFSDFLYITQEGEYVFLNLGQLSEIEESIVKDAYKNGHRIQVLGYIGTEKVNGYSIYWTENVESIDSAMVSLPNR